jgi:ferredoxin
MKVSISIDDYRCKGCGACAMEEPKIFTVDDENDRIVAKDEPVELTEDIERAIAYCPKDCIEID